MLGSNFGMCSNEEDDVLAHLYPSAELRCAKLAARFDRHASMTLNLSGPNGPTVIFICDFGW